MNSIFMCCISGQSKKVEKYEEKKFDRFNSGNISVRCKISPGKRITGMAKFRASQKKKRESEGSIASGSIASSTETETSKNSTENEVVFYKLALERCYSQPTLRKQNYTPYDA